MTAIDRPAPILAATDFSAAARHAAERAALIAEATAAALELLHVIDLAPLERLRRLIDGAPADLEAGLLQAAQRRLGEQAAALRRRYPEAPATRVATGALPAELGRQAAALGAGLLVCGARGESAVRYFVLGSTASRLLDAASCPVLVVKQLPHERYRRVLVPVDLSPMSLPAIQDARRYAPGASLVLLHAFDVPFEGYMRYAGVEQATVERYRQAASQEALARLGALREQAGLAAGEAELVVLHGNPIVSIIEQEQECDCDLIVMGKHGQSLFEKLLLGSVTKHVLAGSQGDVLVSVPAGLPTS